ncbi:MAG: TatD family hydrolase [Mangrovibacterium sp.]
MKLVNLHTHLPLGNNQTGLINHPAQLDFLPKPGQYYSAGLHPWDIPDEGAIELLEQLARLSNHPQVLAIGECGIDRSIETPIDLQQAIFTQQIELAENLHKPLIIHAVRTYSDLLQLKKSSRSTVPWILHSYSGNAETTRQLIKQGFFFSFGAALLKNQAKLNQSLLLVPPGRLFLETDESTVNIESIYIFAASLFGMAVSELQTTVFDNFQRIINR